MQALTALKPLMTSSSPSFAVRAEIYAGLSRILSRLRVETDAASCLQGTNVLHVESARMVSQHVALLFAGRARLCACIGVFS